MHFPSAHPLTPHMSSTQMVKIEPFKWYFLVLCIVILTSIGLFTASQPDTIIDWAKNHTLSFIPLVSGAGFCITIILLHLFLGKKSGNQERTAKQIAIAKVAALLIGLLILSSFILSKNIQQSIFSQDIEIFNPIISSEYILPTLFSIGSLAAGLGYYGVIYRHKKNNYLDEIENELNRTNFQDRSDKSEKYQYVTNIE